jgi:thioester reductase-like protein
VRAYLADGGHGRVYRVGTVAPQWSTGRFQRNIDGHFFSRFLRATLTLGILADWPTRAFLLIPADRLAAMIVDLAGASAADRRTFHLQSPHPLAYRELGETLVSLGYPVQTLEPEVYRARLLRLGVNAAHIDDVSRLMPQLTSVDDGHVRLDTAWTDEWLTRMDLDYPRPEPDWIGRFVDHGVAVGYFPERRQRG